MSFVVTYPPVPPTASPEVRAFLESLRQNTLLYLNSLQSAQFTIAAGTNITLTTTGSVTTISASGGGGGGNGVTVTVAFGGGADTITTTVTGQTWVDASTSSITATLTDGPSGRSVEEGMLEELTWGVNNLVDGTGFDLIVHSPNGKAYGSFNFYCVGT